MTIFHRARYVLYRSQELGVPRKVSRAGQFSVTGIRRLCYAYTAWAVFILTFNHLIA